MAELLGRDQAVGVAVAGGRVVVGLRQMDGLGGDRGDLEGYRPTDRVDLHHLRGGRYDEMEERRRMRKRKTEEYRIRERTRSR